MSSARVRVDSLIVIIKGREESDLKEQLKSVMNHIEHACHCKAGSFGLVAVSMVVSLDRVSLAS